MDRRNKHKVEAIQIQINGIFKDGRRREIIPETSRYKGWEACPNGNFHPVWSQKLATPEKGPAATFSSRRLVLLHSIVNGHFEPNLRDLSGAVGKHLFRKFESFR